MLDSSSMIPQERVERLVAGRGQVVGKLLEWLVRHRTVRVRRSRAARSGPRPRRARGTAAPRGCSTARARRTRSARPGRSAVAGLAEVLLAKPVGRGAVELRRPADEVVDARLERPAVPVVPRVRRDVAVVHEYRLGQPVPRARAGASRRARAGGSACRARGGARAFRPRARPDDDHVVGIHCEISSARSARMIRAAASISARCENACGKFPGGDLS